MIDWLVDFLYLRITTFCVINCYICSEIISAAEKINYSLWFLPITSFMFRPAVKFQLKPIRMWPKDSLGLAIQNKLEILEFLKFEKSVRRKFAEVSCVTCLDKSLSLFCVTMVFSLKYLETIGKDLRMKLELEASCNWDFQLWLKVVFRAWERQFVVFWIDVTYKRLIDRGYYTLRWREDMNFMFEWQ